MKKSSLFLIISIMIMSLVACGNQTEADNTETEKAEAEKVETENATEKSVYQLTPTMQVKEQKDGKVIMQTDTISGRQYSLTLNLENAAGYTAEEQLVMCTRLFWYCYPAMYEKMAVEETPVDVNLLVENSGYEIAEQWGNNVHIHDKWLYEHPEDFDCLTHEFAHVIQTDWTGDYSPCYEGDAYLIERFADACRYLYAYEDGLYNNKVWTLHTPSVENHYSNSNRFWVWVEQTYSTNKVDIFQRIVKETQIKDEAHDAMCWDSDGSMWEVVFEGTAAQGKTIEELWDEFLQSDFAWEELENQ